MNLQQTRDYVKQLLVKVFPNVNTLQDLSTSENNKLLFKGKVIGGGEGGTSDYLDLENKPKINNVELNGDKSLEDLGIEIPDPYTLPIATNESLGGIKIGDNLTITEDGTLSAQAQSDPYELPIASDSILGGIKIGNNLTIEEDGTLNAEAASDPYVLPAATDTTLGGIRVGDNLTIDENGVLSAISGGGSGGGGDFSDYEIVPLLDDGWYQPGLNSTLNQYELKQCIDDFDFLLMQGYGYVDSATGQMLSSIVIPKKDFYYPGGHMIYENTGRRLVIYFITEDKQSVVNISNADSDPSTGVKNIYGIKMGRTSNPSYNPTLFSEEEQIVGSWLDGRPLYQKTVVISNDIYINDGYSYTFDEYTEIKEVAQCYTLDSVSGNYLIIPVDYQGSIILGYYQEGRGITFFINNNIFGWDRAKGLVITIRYTKTTDEPHTFELKMLKKLEGYQPLVHSKHEQIVGCWINGKPLYQKTITFNNVYLQSKSLELGLSDIELIMVDSSSSVSQELDSLPFPYIHGTNTRNIIGFFFEGGSTPSLVLRPGPDIANQYCDFTITFRYTKTIDEENSFTPSMLYKEFLTDEELAAAAIEDKI